MPPEGASGRRARLEARATARARAADVAAGRRPADLVIRDVRLVNTLTAEIYPAQIAVAAGLVAAVRGAEEEPFDGEAATDGRGRFAVPGLIDSHLHIESSMVLPPAFAAAVVPRGVTTIIADPHEIGNVLGLEGVDILRNAARGLPMDVFFQVPSCVPASPLETAGAEIGPDEVRRMLADDDVLAVGEMMDFPGVVAGEGRTAAILREALRHDAVIEGHAPNLTGGALAAYVAGGVTSDHTYVTPALAVERLRSGVTLQIQRKTLSADTLREAAARARSLNLCLVTDDVMPDDLLRLGHLDALVREAMGLGLDPVEAIRAATLAPARRMRLADRGAIAPGLVADIVLTESLEAFAADEVFYRGRLVARRGALLEPARRASTPPAARATVRIGPPPLEAFRVTAPAGAGDSVRVRVMGMRPDTTYTDALTETLAVRGGRVAWEASELCLAAVFERHGRAGTTGYGFVDGALRDGAVAMTWAHDSHNLLVLGRDPRDMAAAARWIVERQGGMAAARGGAVIAGVPMPVAGILSEGDVPEVARDLAAFREAVAALGFVHASPIMALGVLPLAVSPALKITDRGLVDVARGEVVPLFV
jgi:adenine deaminase